MKRLTFPLADNYLLALTVCVLLVLAMVASCLNPIAFNPGDTSIKIEGEIEIKDKAVLWVINTTKTVSVTNLTITREDNPSLVYPQTFTGTFEKGVPSHGESFGTYHWPNANFFNVEVSYTNADGSETGSKTIRMQMLRAQDYIIWVYRSADGNINIAENMPTMPDPNDWEEPSIPPQPDKEFPVVIRNVTQNRNITRLEFAHSNSGMRVVMENEGPHARDQRAVFLAAGEWIVTAHYNIAGGGTGSSADRHILIDSRTFQAGKPGTLLLYFYASKAATIDTDFTQWWPPIPNDVSSNDNDTIYTGNQGALQVANKSETGSFIVDIMIDNVLRYDGGINGNVYKDDTTAPPFILGAGLHQIKFRTNKTAGGFGPAHPVLITAGQLRTLSFYDALSDLDTLPPDDGYGSGLIKIINKSKLPAYEIRIAKATNTATQMVIGSNQFQPSGPVNGDGSSGYVDVVGTATFPVENDDYYVIYVILKNTSGDKTIQRIAYLKDRVVEITIEEKDLPVEPDIPATIGATIKVKNEVPSTISDSGRTLPLEVLITTVTPYNISTKQGYPYSTTTWTPSGFISNNQTAQFMVYDSPQMPITQTATFTSTVLAIVSVGSGDNIRTGYAMVTIPLSPDGALYSTTPPSHIRDIKLTYDLIKQVVDPLIPPVDPDPGTDPGPGTDPNPQFIPVVNVELQSATINKDIDTIAGPYNQLNWTVFPVDATNQNGAWTAGDMAVMDSTYKVLDNGGVWVSSAYTKTYLNVAIVIPNGIALGDRRPSLEIVNTEGQIGFLRFDATKDYVKTFKLAFGTTSPQPPQGTGTYNVKIIRDGGGSQTGIINYLVFRPHTGSTLSYSSYSSQDSGFVCSEAITLPTTWSPPGASGDIYFDVSSVKPKNQNSKEVKIPVGKYQIFEVIGTSPLGYSVTSSAPFNTAWTESSDRGAHVIISASPYFKPSGIPNGYTYPVHVLYGTMPAHN